MLMGRGDVAEWWEEQERGLNTPLTSAGQGLLSWQINLNRHSPAIV